MNNSVTRLPGAQDAHGHTDTPAERANAQKTLKRCGHRSSLVTDRKTRQNLHSADRVLRRHAVRGQVRRVRGTTVDVRPSTYPGAGDPVRRPTRSVRDGRRARLRLTVRRAGHARVRARRQRQDRAGRGGGAARAARHGVGHARARRRRARPLLGRGADRARPRRRRPGRQSALAALAAPVRESRDAFMPLLVNALADAPRARRAGARRRPRAALARVPDAALLPAAARAGHAAARAHRPQRPGAAAARAARARPARPRSARPTSRSPRTRRASCSPRTGSTLDHELVKALHSRTEGWGAGLRLAALSLQGREDPDRFVAEFAGDDRVVGDYLLAEVLDRQPPRLRAFLLRTALVDRVCGSLADALTGDEQRRGHARHARAHQRVRARRRRSPRVVPLPPPVRQAAAHARRARAGGASCRTCTRAPPAGTPRAAPAVEALEHAVAGAASGTWRWRSSPSTGSTCTCAATPPRSARCSSQLPAGPARAATPSSAAALACAALDVGDTEAAERHLGSTPSRLPACPSRGAAATWRRWRSPASATARLEGDFEAALQRRGRAAGRGRRARRRPDDGAARRSCTRMLGETALWAHNARPRRRGAEQGGRARPRRTGSTTSRVSALSYLALLDVMVHGPADEQGHGLRGDRARRRSAAGRRSRRRRARTPALALHAFYDLRPARPREHLEHARARRRRSCAAASWTS